MFVTASHSWSVKMISVVQNGKSVGAVPSSAIDTLFTLRCMTGDDSVRSFRIVSLVALVKSIIITLEVGG